MLYSGSITVCLPQTYSDLMPTTSTTERGVELETKQRYLLRAMIKCCAQTNISKQNNQELSAFSPFCLKKYP